MNKEELLAKLTEIGTSEDAANRRNLITEITDEISGVYDANTSLTQANAKFAEDNKTLQEYNMKLFLKVGGQKKSEPAAEKDDDPTKNLKYEDLFNDKGELK